MISDNFQKLFEEAKKVREKAHVPYSKFKVGAAFLTENNTIVAGCNVENAAYPQSQCAEATAIGNLISQGYKKIAEIKNMELKEVVNNVWMNFKNVF